MNSTVTAGPPVPQPIGTDRRGPLRVVRFVFGHSTCASRLLRCFRSLFLPLRLPAYRYQTYRPVYRHRCYLCGPRLIYERRYIERQFVERRYGYGGATAVTTAILRTGLSPSLRLCSLREAIDPGRGLTAMVTAVSGAAGHRRMPKDTDGPDIPDMRTSRDRRRRFRTTATTKPFQERSGIRQHCWHRNFITSSGRIATARRADPWRCSPPARSDFHSPTPCPQA